MKNPKRIHYIDSDSPGDSLTLCGRVVTAADTKSRLWFHSMKTACKLCTEKLRTI